MKNTTFFFDQLIEVVARIARVNTFEVMVPGEIFSWLLVIVVLRY